MLGRLFLENTELDLSEYYSNQITYALDDIRNIDSKSTPVTKTIILPGSARNNKALGHIFEIGVSNFTVDGFNVGYNFNASKSAECRYEINGMTVIKGTFRLLEIIKDGNSVEYEAQIVGELGGFVNSLGNKRLEDIDFSDYDHSYTTTEIVSSWDQNYTYDLPGSYQFTSSTKKLKVSNKILSLIREGQSITISGTSNNGTYTVSSIVFSRVVFNRYTEIELLESVTNETGTGINIVVSKPFGKGYYYPLIDYGNVSQDKHDFQYTAFRPALFFREYLDRIITGAGYTYDSDFLDTNFIKRLIIPNNAKGLFNPDNTFYITANNTNTYSVSGTGIQSFFIQFPTNTLSGFTPDGTNTVFTYSSPTTINTKVKIKISGKYRRIELALGTMAVQIFTTQAQTVYNFPLKATYGDFSFNIELDASFATGNIIDVRVHAAGSVSDFGPLLVESAELTVEKDPPGAVELPIGSLVKINDGIPKGIFQRDFFVSFLKMFNIIVDEDKFKIKHLKLEPDPDFYQQGNYENWSGKINNGVIKIKPMSELNARYYQFKYKQDGDYFNESYRKKYNEGYGDRIYDTAYDFAKDTDSLELIFSSSVLTGYPNEDKIFPSIYKKSGNGGFEDTIEHNIRIMQAKKIEGVESWNILDGSNVLTTLTSYGYAGHFDDPDAPNADINFGIPKEIFYTLVIGNPSNNLFNAYYSPYMAEITDKDSKLLTAEFRLTPKDIYQLDFSRFKYIDGQLYRLLKVIDWNTNGEELTKCELLKVINTTY